MRSRVVRVGALLFGSGFCALIYQTVWLRELRAVFGASTAASAAVLAIFMGGLGLGGALLGRRADKVARPLAFYGSLELMVAAGAAVTPLLVRFARTIYAALGGSVVLGAWGGTAVRLVLATLLLGAPTFVMGGTLPAAARAVETADDPGRRNLAVLYGLNTLGALTGAALSTFLLLEIFGARLTLWLACLVNLLVGMLARAVDRGLSYENDSKAVEADAEKSTSADVAHVPAGLFRFVLMASMGVGFAFLLMELVWYRMLAPLLGGSLYTFGLILVIALLGIGLGGATFAALGKGRVSTVRGLALTCTAEAVFIAVPYALGDRLAILTIMLRSLGGLGFYGHVAGWTVIASIVVLPAAFVSGIQFPLLIGLLGRGGRDVGRHVGLTYAANTVGAIAGSLAGGFGLLPILSAPGAWRVVVELLVAIGLAAALLSFRLGESRTRAALPVLVGALAVLLLVSDGPSGAWRHSPIGAGRADDVAVNATRQSIKNWINQQRRDVYWQADGLESSVALSRRNGFAFLVNGKSDGEARIDAPTQVMLGLIGSFIHGQPKTALVVGLGTGSTAGWLAKLPSIERVDVVELEPAIVQVARDCAAVNEAALDNPKVHLFIGDAREVLLTTPRRYDLIFSEPSNPYRAGVCGLFTEEYYRAAAQKLSPGGIFLQFVQAYEIDVQSVKTVYATIGSVFGEVHTWHTGFSDLVLMASLDRLPFDAAALRARAIEEPYKSAFADVWRVTDLEGVLGHYAARPSLAREIAERETEASINTDDRNLLEFAFARNVGTSRLFALAELSDAAAARGEDRPEIAGEIDWASVGEQRSSIRLAEGGPPVPFHFGSRAEEARFEAKRRWARSDYPGAIDAWQSQAREPATLGELAVVAESLADAGNEGAAASIEKLRPWLPGEADAFTARLRFRQGKVDDSVEALERAFDSYRSSPWPLPDLMDRAIDLAVEIGSRHKKLAPRLYQALKSPFALHLLHTERIKAAAKLPPVPGFRVNCSEQLAPFHHQVPWEEELLASRVACYGLSHPRHRAAEADLEAFLEYARVPFRDKLTLPEPQTR